MNNQPSVYDKLEDLAQSQEAVSRQRKDVLVERTLVQNATKATQSQRTLTRDVEVAFMNQTRELVSQSGQTLPASIITTYDSLVEAHEKLGLLDEQQAQAERALGASEWKLLVSEDALYQYDIRLIVQNQHSSIPRHDSPASFPGFLPPPPPPPPPFHLSVPIIASPLDPSKNQMWARELSRSQDRPPPPSPPPQQRAQMLNVRGKSPVPPQNTSSEFSRLVEQYHTATLEQNHLRRIFNSLRLEQMEYLKLDQAEFLGVEHLGDSNDEDLESALTLMGSSDFFDTYSMLLTRLKDCEIQVEHLKHEIMQHKEYGSHESRHARDSIWHRSASNLALGSKDHGLIRAWAQDPDPKGYIRDWLLDLLKNNAIERMMYSNFLEEYGISVTDRNSLEDLAEKHWLYGSTDDWPQPSDETVPATFLRSSVSSEGNLPSIPITEYRVVPDNDDSLPVDSETGTIDPITHLGKRNSSPAGSTRSSNQPPKSPVFTPASMVSSLSTVDTIQSIELARQQSFECTGNDRTEATDKSVPFAEFAYIVQEDPYTASPKDTLEYTYLVAVSTPIPISPTSSHTFVTAEELVKRSCLRSESAGSSTESLARNQREREQTDKKWPSMNPYYGNELRNLDISPLPITALPTRMRNDGESRSLPTTKPADRPKSWPLDHRSCAKQPDGLECELLPLATRDHLAKSVYADHRTTSSSPHLVNDFNFARAFNECAFSLRPSMRSPSNLLS